jgi:SEC-C motif-containing protein
MRSRYAAFALGLARYLIETLAPGHPDLATPEAAHVRELASIKDVRRFMGLRIYGEWVEGDRGEVLFAAKLFERGQNVGIAELSSFERREGRWRYVSGVLMRLADLPASELASLTRERFLALAKR